MLRFPRPLVLKTRRAAIVAVHLLLTVRKFVIEALAGLYSIMEHILVLDAFDVVLFWRADLCCCLNQALKIVWGATEQVDL